MEARYKAYYRWHLPYAKPSAARVIAAATNYSSLLNLNDDCLDVIFKYLTLKDQTNLAQCCRRLQDVFFVRAKVEYKIFNFEDLNSLQLCQIRLFFRLTGPQIQELTVSPISNHFKRALGFLIIYCLNVKILRITGVRLRATTLQCILKNMYMVEELQLDDNDLRDDCIPVLKMLKNLKILSLDNNNYLSGKHIEGLTTLESLSLHGSIIQSPMLLKVCKKLADLKYLDIRQCHYIDLDGIAKYTNKLETIKLSYDQADGVAYLPSLKHLTLNTKFSINSVPSRVFKDLVNHRADQLETLAVFGNGRISHADISKIGELRKLKNLICPDQEFDDNCLSNISKLQELELLHIKYCESFSVEDLFVLIQKCPNLSTLHVSDCRQLNIKFASRVFHSFIEKKPDEKKTLKIISRCKGRVDCYVIRTVFKMKHIRVILDHEDPVI